MKKNMNPVALEFKAMILKSGYTQSEIVDMMSADYGWSGSPSNFSRKLNEGTLRYDQALELAKALVVVLVDKEQPVASMRSDVIHDGGSRPDPLRCTHAAPWLLQQMLRPEALPCRRAVQAVIRGRRAALVLWPVPLAPAVSCQLRAPWMPAGPQRPESHRLSPRWNPSQPPGYTKSQRPVNAHAFILGAGCRSTGRCR